MSIVEELTALSGRIQDAYTALEAKGATMPASRTSYNLSSTIGTIPSGGGSVYGISSITQLVGENVNGTLTPSQTPFALDMTGIKVIPNNGLDNKFYNNNGLTSVSFPDLESVGEEGMRSAFYGCSNLIDSNRILTISFPKLSSVSYYSFYQTFANVLHNDAYYIGDTITVNFPALTTINANSVFYRMFYWLNYSSNLNSCTVNFPVLTSASGTQIFQSFINPTGSGSNEAHIIFNFPELTTATCGTAAGQAWFYQVTSAKRVDVYMPKCNSITNNFMFPNNNKYYVHFASANQSALEATTGYATHWGGTSVNVLFDM